MTHSAVKATPIGWVGGILMIPGLLLTMCVSCADPPPGSGSDATVIGMRGSGRGQFNYPRAIVATRDRFYVVDKAGRVQGFDHAGSQVVEWQMPEISAGKPVGLGADQEGNVYVADTHYARVGVYAPDGTPRESFGDFDPPDGVNRLPTDVVVLADGTSFVGEYGGMDRVTRYDPQRTPQDYFDGRPRSDDEITTSARPRRFQRPQALCLDPSHDYLWVADVGQHRLCKLTLDGEIVDTIGTLGNGAGQFRYPYGIDFLSDGTLIVAEYGNNRVQRLTPDGTSLGTWGSAGRQRGQLASPWGVAVLPDDRVVIVDAGNNRLQIIDGADPQSWTPFD